MPQPLFIEVTDYHRKETRIVGLAWITDILRNTDNAGETGAVIVVGGGDKGKIVTVETYDEVKAALGTIWKIA